MPDEEKVPIGKIILWSLLALALLTAVGWGLRFAGVWGERVAFVTSFQYSESKKAEIATFEAQLISLRHQLTNPKLNVGTRTNLESQVLMVQQQLEAARRR